MPGGGPGTGGVPAYGAAVSPGGIDDDEAPSEPRWSDGGRARNCVSHFGQRMRAPSSGTDSFFTRYFEAQPGQVTIMGRR